MVKWFAFFTDGSYTKSTRAHRHRELIREQLWFTPTGLGLKLQLPPCRKPRAIRHAPSLALPTGLARTNGETLKGALCA